jgi:hypothetical protein
MMNYHAGCIFFCKEIVLLYFFFLNSGYHIVIGCNNSNLDVLPTIFYIRIDENLQVFLFNFCLKLYASGCNYIFDQFAWDAVLYFVTSNMRLDVSEFFYI